jgi:putative FmdB family regulatory protein
VPTYSYACKECGHRFEARQGFTDPALTECPACSGPLRKLFNSVGVVFKGSGFYRTDSRSDASRRPKSGAATPSGPKPASPSESSSSSSSSSSSGSDGGSSPASSSSSSSSSSTPSPKTPAKVGS